MMTPLRELAPPDGPSRQRVREGDVVAFRYLIRAASGNVLAACSEIVRYVQGGDGPLPRALSSRLLGRRDGETFTVTLKAEEAFGDGGATRRVSLPRERFSKVLTLDPGSRVDTKTAAGDEVSVWVVDATEHEVVVDFEHPWAGQHLDFEIAILSIRVGTDAEQRAGRPSSRAELQQVRDEEVDADLIEQVATLRRLLVERFGDEERLGGLHEGITHRSHGHARRVEGLQDTHGEILGSLDDLVEQLEDADPTAAHRSALHALLAQVAEHESVEAALVQDSYLTDLGGEG